MSIATGAQEKLEAIVAAHGGAAVAKEAVVRFAYSLRVLPGERLITLSEVAFRPGDFEHLWVRAAPEGVLQRFDLTAPGGGLGRELAAAGGLGLATEEEEAVDFALRSIRYFFLPALAFTAGRWEFRTLLAPPGVEAPAPLEAACLEPGSPHGPCLLEADAGTGLLRRVVYAGRHPFVAGAVHAVAFSDYVEAGGLWVAGRRVHRALRPPAERVPDPFARLRGPPAADEVSLEEEVSGLRIVAPEEAEALYPLPAEETTAAGPTVELE
jgi:hypothetical protein